MRTEVTLLAVALAALPTMAMDRLIRVSGDALVESRPDYAIIRLNLEARDRLLKRARLSHEADIASVMAVVAKYKILPSDVAQDFPEIESRADGFLVRRTIQVTMRDLKNYDSMLFDLYDSAAVTVETVEFRVNELRKLRDQAREMAMQAAEDKVQLMAKAMKRHVGRVMDVRVDAGGGTLLRRRGQAASGPSPMSQMAQNSYAVADAPTAGAELFRVPITAKVDVEYEIIE